MVEIDKTILAAAVNAVCREEYGCAPESIPNVAARVREASEVALRAVIPLIEVAAFERAAESFAGPASWLERHATHVGKCEGGDRCTCGLTLARHEAATAIRSLKETAP